MAEILSVARLAAELAEDVCNTLESCLRTLREDDTNWDFVVSRVDSALLAISDISSIYSIPWAHSISQQLELVTELLLESEHMGQKRRGRPKVALPVTTIESLVSMNFKVPEIAKMFNVSVTTVFRTMRENNISVKL